LLTLPVAREKKEDGRHRGHQGRKKGNTQPGLGALGGREEKDWSSLRLRRGAPCINGYFACSTPGWEVLVRKEATSTIKG